MSLFANYANQSGDIWSLSGIVFTSPVNDLLDSDDFTLEQLLEVNFPTLLVYILVFLLLFIGSRFTARS